MTLEEIRIKFKVGILVDAKTKDGKMHTGYLDTIGLTQEEGNILLSNVPVVPGMSFTGRKIKIADITELVASRTGAVNF